MYQIDNATAATLPPTVSPVGPNPGGFFTTGVPGSVAATVLDADFVNAVQQELCNVITAAGIGLSKSNQAQLLQALHTLGRIKLTNTLNLYVATTGSDTANTGMTSGSPFLTLQHAYNYMASTYDIAGQNVIINVAPGTYTAGVQAVGYVSGAYSVSGSGGINQILFLGSPSTPDSTVINVSGAITECFGAFQGDQFSISGFHVTATGTGADCISVGQNSAINISGPMDFGACTNAHIAVVNLGVVFISCATYTITGSAAYHYLVQAGAILVQNNAVAVTISAGLSFSASVFGVSILAYLAISTGSTFGGSNPTGQKYTLSNNAVFGSNGVTLPGTTAGSTTTGGQFS